jgi:hypothetical protein
MNFEIRKRRIFILFFLFTVSCNTFHISNTLPTATIDNTLIDKSWLTDEPCKAPCWYGLEIGKTTQSEAKILITKLSFIQSANIKEQKSYGKNKSDILLDYYLPCKNVNHSCSIITFRNDILVSIYLIPNYEITIGEVVDELGDPDLTDIGPVVPNGCIADLIWIQRQMVIRLYENSDASLFKKNMYDTLKEAEYKPSQILLVESIIFKIPEDITPIFKFRNWEGFTQ